MSVRQPSLGAIVLMVMVGLVVGAFVTGRYLTPSGRADRAHDRAVERWEAQEPAAYSFDFSYCSGFCAGCELHVEVRDGAVVRTDGDPSDCPFPRDDPPTIEDVFTLEKAIRHDPSAGSSSVEYDPSSGYTMSVVVRCAEAGVDCGTGLSVTNFEAAP